VQLPGGFFRLQLVHELIQAVEVDPGSETEGVRLHLEPRDPGRLPAGSQAEPESFVDRGLEALARPAHFHLKALRDIRLEGQGRPHADIMMPAILDVKMPRRHPLTGEIVMVDVTLAVVK
jgi:hypothetical protein